VVCRGGQRVIPALPTIPTRPAGSARAARPVGFARLARSASPARRTVIVIGIRPRPVDDTDAQVTTGEVLKETLGKVKLACLITLVRVGYALCAILISIANSCAKCTYLIDAVGNSRLSVDCDRQFLAAASSSSTTKLLSSNGCSASTLRASEIKSNLRGQPSQRTTQGQS
jgi:hypothetical protein